MTARNIDGVVKIKVTDGDEPSADDFLKLTPKRTQPKTVRTIEKKAPAEPLDLEDLIDSFAEEEANETEATNEASAYQNSEMSEEKSVKNTTKSDKKTAKKAAKEAKKAEKVAKNEKSKAGALKIVSRILSLLTTAAFGVLIYRIISTNILPTKYLVAGIAAAVLIAGFFIFKAFRKKTKKSAHIILDVLSVLLIVASVFAYIKIDETMDFLASNLDGVEKTYAYYNVIVNKESPAESLDDVKYETFHALQPFTDDDKLDKAIKERAEGTVEYSDDLSKLLDETVNDTEYVLVLQEGTYEGIVRSSEQGAEAYGANASLGAEGDANINYAENLKVIARLEVETKKTEKVSNANITKESFLVFLSGIDTRDGDLPETALSDVNMFIAVNPVEKHILMVATPRDYYVPMITETGVNRGTDKLTHAGAYGGLSLSKSTVENLYDLESDYYVRVNFEAVVNLVNAIGGITIYSDVDEPFNCWTQWDCIIQPGYNDVDGKCALGFARERYTYLTGDRHRGENQEQVITQILNKVSTSTTLVSKYSEILSALDGTFETNMTTDDILALVKMQIDDMSPWTIETYNADGTTGMVEHGGMQISVMQPSYSTIYAARAKILEVLEGTTDTTSSTTESETE